MFVCQNSICVHVCVDLWRYPYGASCAESQTVASYTLKPQSNNSYKSILYQFVRGFAFAKLFDLK